MNLFFLEIFCKDTTVTYTTSQHNDFVVGIFLFALLMLEGQHRTADKWLAELVTEIRGTVRSLGQNLLWCLIQPLAYR